LSYKFLKKTEELDLWGCQHYPLGLEDEQLQNDPQRCVVCIPWRRSIREKYPQYEMFFCMRPFRIGCRDVVKLYEFLAFNNVAVDALAVIFDRFLFHYAWPLTFSGVCWLLNSHGYYWEYGDHFKKLFPRDVLSFCLTKE